MDPDPKSIAARFAAGAEIGEPRPLGRGHIHVTWRVPAGPPNADIVLQQINTRIFREPIVVMRNIRRVTAHLRSCVEKRGADPKRHCLELLEDTSGEALYRAPDGSCWRAYRYIANAQTYDQPGSPAQAREAARAYGAFLRDLAKLPADALAETIPRFHDTHARLTALEQAAAADVHDRCESARGELAFAVTRRGIADTADALARELPRRDVHNDTKLNNLLFDEHTGEALCVVDLDTVMPGFAPLDLGDLLRSCLSTKIEDTRNAHIEIDERLVAALAGGFKRGADGLLTLAEQDAFIPSAVQLAYELGVRFLTDYLGGDGYFTAHYPAQNLDRCRVQFALVRALQRRAGALEVICRSA